MRKAVTTLLALITALNLLYSQKDNRETIFTVSAGCSVPYSEFAGKTMNYYDGFASPGMNLETGLLRYADRFFGFSCGIGYASFFFSERAYQAEYDRILGGFGKNRVTAGNYQVLKGMAGIVIKIPETRQMEAMLLIQLGAAMSVHPNLVVTNSKLGEINSVRRNSDWNLAAALGLKVNYWMTERYGLSLDCNLNSTRPDFRDDTGIGNIFFLPIRYMNINVGFVMKL